MWSVLNAVCEFGWVARIALTFLVGAACCVVIVGTFAFYGAAAEGTGNEDAAMGHALLTLCVFYGVGYVLMRWVF
jgi:hypothetical protein